MWRIVIGSFFFCLTSAQWRPMCMPMPGFDCNMFNQAFMPQPMFMPFPQMPPFGRGGGGRSSFASSFSSSSGNGGGTVMTTVGGSPGGYYTQRYTVPPGGSKTIYDSWNSGTPFRSSSQQTPRPYRPPQPPRLPTRPPQLPQVPYPQPGQESETRTKLPDGSNLVTKTVVQKTPTGNRIYTYSHKELGPILPGGGFKASASLPSGKLPFGDENCNCPELYNEPQPLDPQDNEIYQRLPTDEGLVEETAAAASASSSGNGMMETSVMNSISSGGHKKGSRITSISSGNGKKESSISTSISSGDSKKESTVTNKTASKAEIS